MTPAQDRQLECKALILSVIGALFMSLLGIGFSLLTGSAAILLDGKLSLVGFDIGLLAIRISTLVQRPDDEHFQFGYASFEPLFNLGKGVINVFVGIYAGLDAMLNGGRPIETGYALI